MEFKRDLCHTASHVLAMAVKNIYPLAKLGIGPAIDGGFYYDFEFATPIKELDLRKIESEMGRIIKLNLPVIRKEMTRAEASRILTKLKEPYKLELLNDIAKNEKISFYYIGEFGDLCAGPHLEEVGGIKEFKLTKITGAYWRGNEKNKMLTRIYGVAFDRQGLLMEYEKEQEEALKRDHNKLGRELGIFMTSEIVGQGLPLFMPNGAKLMEILTRFVEDEETKRGYLRTRTPSLAKSDLFKISGHWEHYKDGMFILGNEVLDEEVFALRPMTCPFQILCYKNDLHSYKELPIRYAETSPQFRKESSGEMHGIIRLRQFTISDAHIFLREDQVQQVFDECLDLTMFLLRILRLDKAITFRLSKWDPKNREKYIDDAKMWEKSQDAIRKVLLHNKLEFTEADGEAAFYGPKIDIQTKNVHGKEDTIITIQLDLALPKLFGLSYINDKGEKVMPYMVHRTSIGCYERTIAMLLEQTSGNLPLWLAPIQIIIMGVTNEQDDYCLEVKKLLTEKFRCEVDLRNEKLGLKIREAARKKIPIKIVVGAKEAASATVSVDGKEMSVDELVTKLEKQIHEEKS
ncbi:MAG: threonine--tRNA ligase [Christensenellaceae bacterium]|jgi:threonyl-tRNA synthetase|nr:threonine--tRNA ligase [Christensenellaceae bacterium]